NNFRLVTQCLGAMFATGPGTSSTFTNTDPLVVGQYYYIAMDGARGDVCDWTFSVLDGSTEVAPLTQSGAISGPRSVCPGVPQQYFVTQPSGATETLWELNGGVTGNEDTLNLTFPAEGTYELCVRSFNACNTAEPNCQTIIVQEIPDNRITEFACDVSCYDFADTTLCESGVYTFDFITETNCDSTVILDLTFLPADTNRITTDICSGDTLRLAEQAFTATDVYETLLTNRFGCDSLIVLDLTVVECNIQADFSISPIVCQGESNGGFSFAVTNATPPLTYQYERLGGPPLGGGNITTLNTPITVNDLPAGTYLVNIDDNFGNTRVLIIDLLDPDLLAVELQSSQFNGFAASCFGANDASLMALGQGGRPPYVYNWSTAETTPEIDNLTPGTYRLSLTDALGCALVDSVTITEPDPLVLAANFVDPTCEQPENGMIQVASLTGGVGGYRYRIDALDTFSSSTDFAGLAGGEYTLEVIDANGCTMDTLATLEVPIIPSVEAGATQIINLGTSVPLSVQTNIAPDSVQWSPTESLSCVNCPNPLARPLGSQWYTVSVTSPLGCTRADSVEVIVVPQRKVYAPNAFSPNGDGVNDFFALAGGQDTEAIISLQVFDRWGNQVYDGRENPRWNGDARGRIAVAGVYVWLAQVQFIDGVSQQLSGQVMLLR
ncbi:MAG: gliding motility-associated C-terminal domain-containing protein, partial [Bacteroidota bacterium]